MLAITQFLGVLIAIPAIALRSEAVPVGADLGWSVLSGLFGVVGLACLYHGLSVGRMGVVAPVAGVLVTVIPVTAGFLLEGVPPPVAIAGIGVAIVSVFVVSRVPAEATGRSSGFWWGLAAGLTLGGFTVTVSFVADGLVFGPLAIIRATEGLACVAVILATRQAWRIPRGQWPVIALIGTLDMSGTAAYVAATQSGPLAIAAVLSALYPVATVILAAVVLRERVSRLNAFGVVLAGVAVALIAGGSAAA